VKVWLKPTGGVIKGHVLDCAIGPLSEKLRDYDAQLYVKWNPKKLKGWGCWEIRRRPEEMKVSEVEVFGGNTFVKLAYVENNLVNHVLDVPFLNYKILEKLKDMDQWKDDSRGADFNKRADYLEAKYDEKVEQHAEDEKNYMIKQHKSQIRDFKEYVLSGGNPYRLADYWGK
jgi:hypothetical protein